LLGQEHEHLHRVPRLAHTLCFGQTRKVDRQATVSVGDAIYSVPHELIGERVWVRADGQEMVGFCPINCVWSGVTDRPVWAKEDTHELKHRRRFIVEDGLREPQAPSTWSWQAGRAAAR